MALARSGIFFRSFKNNFLLKDFRCLHFNSGRGSPWLSLPIPVELLPFDGAVWVSNFSTIINKWQIFENEKFPESLTNKVVSDNLPLGKI
ncbi:MAG: hypothetical protein MUF15_19845 [Acidobacteria bacterium]|nr:hypothetical protein [Acidobacteriota bacterium]